jgi:hypothetical protein
MLIGVEMNSALVKHRGVYYQSNWLIETRDKNINVNTFFASLYNTMYRNERRYLMKLPDDVASD